jgi:preprotein translocase subunit Sss1
MKMNVKDLPCFQHVKWDPSRTELFTFSRAMLIGFALIGLLVAWRQDGFGTATFTLWGIGAALAVAGFVPVVGKFAYLAIYVLTGIIGYAISRVILTGIFFLLFTPLGLLLKVMGKDFLRARPHASGTEWIAHARVSDRQSFYRRF